MFSGTLAEKTLELVRVASVTGQEKALADLLEHWLVDHFGRPAVRRWRHGLVVAPGGEVPSVALVGHLDTVPHAESQHLGIRDGRVYGCGASDMKAGVAVMLELLQRDYGRHVCGVFYDQEEGPQKNNGLLPLLKLAPPIELAMVLEPTSNTVQVGCVGSLHARVVVRGQRAHSARPWHGRNAVTEALPLLERLARQEPRAVEIHGQTFHEVLSVTQAHTSNPRNAIPGHFTLNLNYRFAPNKSMEQASDDIAEFLGDAEYEIEELCPSGKVCLDHPLLSTWIACNDLKVEPKQAWTDVAQLTDQGIPAVNFGPGDPGQAHQADEWAPIDGMERGAELLDNLLRS